ncbi:MAG TPA: hypothetical protein VGJ41_09400, partial [Nocardioides sp.]
MSEVGVTASVPEDDDEVSTEVGMVVADVLVGVLLLGPPVGPEVAGGPVGAVVPGVDGVTV